MVFSAQANRSNVFKRNGNILSTTIWYKNDQQRRGKVHGSVFAYLHNFIFIRGNNLTVNILLIATIDGCAG